MKYLLMIAVNFGLDFLKPNKLNDLIAQKSLKDEIRAEISKVAFKFLLGFILVGLILISFSQFIGAFHIYLNQFDNAPAIEMATFGSILILCSSGLLLLFQNRKAQDPKSENDIDATNIPGISTVANNFLQGLTEGYAGNVNQK